MTEKWSDIDEQSISAQRVLKQAARAREATRTLVIGVAYFNALDLTDEQKAYLRTQFTGTAFSGNYYYFRMTEETCKLLRYDGDVKAAQQTQA